MFSIRKKHKVQVLYFHNPSQADILESIKHNNTVSSSVTENLLKIFNTKLSELTNLQPIKNELEKTGIRALKPFFLLFPSAWEELKRKINSHKKERTDGRLYIDKTDEENILSVLLRLGRQDGMGADLEKVFREELLQNPAVLGLSDREPSILDSSHGNLGFLDPRKRVDFIEHMILHGIQKNVDETITDFDSYFLDIFPEIKKYLESIFDIRFDDMGKITTVKGLAKYISGKIWNTDKKGLTSKKAWMVVKAFSAWGGYKEIIKHRQQVEENISRIPDILHDTHGIKLWQHKEIIEASANGESLKIDKYLATITIDDGTEVECNLEFRVKSIRSILLKLWESEDYNNIDALRDVFGMAVIFPDNTPEDHKEKVILKFTQLMSNKGYIVKNKGLLDKGNLANLKESLKMKEKKSLGKVVSSKKPKSNKLFNNASISGFTNLFGIPLGMEVQFYDNEGYEFWKKDHYTFDPLKIVSAWGRGSWFVTPKQLLHIIRKEIPADIRDGILQKLPQDIMMDYITREQIYAFRGKKDEVYFTPIGQLEDFKKKFPYVGEPINPKDEGFKHFIKSLSLSS